MQLFIAQRQEMIVDSPKCLDPEESWGHHFNSNKSCAVRSCSRIWSIESASAFILRNQHVQQGLVNVPFWEYWTSPYSSHYRPYTIHGWVMFNGDISHDPCSIHFSAIMGLIYRKICRNGRNRYTFFYSDRPKTSSAERYDRPCAMKLSFSFSKKALVCPKMGDFGVRNSAVSNMAGNGNFPN